MKRDYPGFVKIGKGRVKPCVFVIFLGAENFPEDNELAMIVDALPSDNEIFLHSAMCLLSDGKYQEMTILHDDLVLRK